MDAHIPSSILRLRETARKVVAESIKPMSDKVDQQLLWPAHSLRALGKAGLMGLNVPKRLGGHEEGLLALAVLSEEIGKACPSSALCYAMHCVGSAVIAAKATPYHEEHYLKPIAEGRHITTLALSEPGSGAHFYFPDCNVKAAGNRFILNGEKDFITNGGQADSYVISTHISKKVKYANGRFNCFILDSKSKGLLWGKPWHGFGMRGNSSKGAKFKNISLPNANLLGKEGDEQWYIFEIVAPYFLMAMAGTYLGIAQSALDIATAHLKARTYSHSGKALAEVQVLQVKLSQLWTAVEKTRGLIYNAAYLGDKEDKSALVSILACKADAGNTAVHVTNEAMTLCGGRAYAENAFLARLLRDARASHVMAPTTTILQEWVGRTLLDLPILTEQTGP